MQIAIQAGDLDRERVDGTRVYLKELLNRFGKLAPDVFFILYHEKDFYPLLRPKHFAQYHEKKIPFSFAWMQTRFAWHIFRDQPDKLFLPIQAAPLWLPRRVEVTATIHDLAWKKYPETFSWKDRLKLNLLLRRVVKRADKLIAVSEATKEDILHYFPNVPREKVRVIHHGFDEEFFSCQIEEKELERILESYQLKAKSYILYVGALQPRKNLVRLIESFGSLKQTHPEAKLVLAGETAWLADRIIKAYEESPYREDIILTGKVDFALLRALYQGACFLAFPSLYEGFGLPILEAFASGIPVLTAHNSSLTDVAGDAALYCDAENTQDMAKKMTTLWSEEFLRHQLIVAGEKQKQRFSWEKCAKETLHYIQEI